MEFKSFPKIQALHKAKMSITQKLHGKNAQVYIYLDENTGNLDLKCGSRTRWINPIDDNYGFAKFVHENKDEFINKLGEGHHFGEWIGQGINSGEGTNERIFVLFYWWKFPPEKPLPPRTSVVPLLYNGDINFDKIYEAMNDLKENGSKLVNGFMRVEGIVIDLNGTKYKKVFNPEETQWQNNKSNKDKKVKTISDVYEDLLQPIRLEKLLSKDERYLKNFPRTILNIANDYINDLIEENQITQDKFEDNKFKIRKDVCIFLKEFIETNYKGSY